MNGLMTFLDYHCFGIYYFPFLLNSYIFNYYAVRVFVHYAKVFFAEGAENRVHCSELRDAHYIEVNYVYSKNRFWGDVSKCSNERYSRMKVLL